MTYDLKRMFLAKEPEALLQKVFGYLSAEGGTPVAFGPFVAAAFLGRKTLPYTVDVLVCKDGGPCGLPRSWTDLKAKETKLKVGELELTAFAMCMVPGVQYHRVRLYYTNKVVTPLELAVMQELGVAQIAYERNDRKKPVFSELFQHNLHHSVVTMARRDSLTPEERRNLHLRGEELARELDFKGVGVIKPKTKPHEPARQPETASPK